MLSQERNYKECIVVMREQLGRIQQAVQIASATHSPSVMMEESVYLSMSILANALGSYRQLREAIALHRQALEGRRKLLGARHMDVSASMTNLALALQHDWQWVEAEALFREELILARQREDGKDTLISITLLAEVLQEQAEACPDGRESAVVKAREALSLYREAVLCAALVHKDVWPTLKARLGEMNVLRTLQGTDAHVERVVRRVVLLLRQSCKEDRAQGFDPLTHGLYELGSVLHELDKFTQAEGIFEEFKPSCFDSGPPRPELNTKVTLALIRHWLL